jgi:hypothetical protein
MQIGLDRGTYACNNTFSNTETITRRMNVGLKISSKLTDMPLNLQRHVHIAVK